MIFIFGKPNMIILTKMGGKEILVNEEQIETAQETPDTVISMSNGHTYIVTETLKEIRDLSVKYRRESLLNRQSPVVTPL